MKKTVILSIGMLLVAVLASAQTVPVIQSQKLAFDADTLNITEANIVRFELKVDSGTYTSLNMPPPANDANTPVGKTTYKVDLPSLTLGPHTLMVRACNTTICSDDSNSLSIKLIVIMTITGLRIVGSF